MGIQRRKQEMILLHLKNVIKVNSLTNKNFLFYQKNTYEKH